MRLDIDTLLAKNPQVDREVLRENTEKAAEAAKLGPGSTAEKPVTSPYGGRRMVVDRAGKDRTRFAASRK